jgi:xylulose-5-phosphate/fructose-6-phosphate phosphoketolase
MVVKNNMSRYQLAIDALGFLQRTDLETRPALDEFERALDEHDIYIREHLEDMPRVRDWTWTAPEGSD